MIARGHIQVLYGRYFGERHEELASASHDAFVLVGKAFYHPQSIGLRVFNFTGTKFYPRVDNNSQSRENGYQNQ